ncbi:MAG: HAMP domain-containing histidine kinase [Muribaculaceae bacterium]|nr:HAMP domain-containing histidine kinase [Muribaculaceae bacterium]MDE6768333.1 HAMP domain-containing histidine kinase [Muribaculaceae bacterium]
MKQFKTISTIFILTIVVIFGCNVFYLVKLYKSIRTTVEQNVMTALADADLDELWIRAERSREKTMREIEAGQKDSLRKGEASVYQDTSGNMVSVTRYDDGSVSSETVSNENDGSFSNKFIDAVGRQFHTIMDAHVGVDFEVMDSVLTKRLNDRMIYPDYVTTEIVNSKNEIILPNPNSVKGKYDTFTYYFNPEANIAYRVHLTPLTRHIFSEMSGVIVTVFLLMIVFAAAFVYLFRTVSRLRTIEEMKDDFVNNVTHELKTPIAIAYSANDALLNYDTVNDPSKRDTYLRIANKQLKRLGELVESILAMSMERRKTLQLKPETIELRSFIEGIAEAQSMRKEKDINIDVSQVTNIEIEADRTHLANVLNNLIDNAIKYSDESVDIVITGDDEDISIADNGIGIPSKSLPYLFNKFYRVPHGNRQDVRGYGIGLYYVKSILDKMGWSINVSSKEREGSVFTIKFNKDEQ